MYKKIAALAGSAALVLGVASSALAYHRSSNGITVENDDTNVTTTSTANSNTGLNFQFGRSGTDQRIRTGDAVSLSTAESSTNSTIVDTCGCSRRGSIKVENDDTNVNTTSTANSNTGLNAQFSGSSRSRHGHHGGSDQSIRTGGALSDSYAGAVTNVTVIGSAE